MAAKKKTASKTIAARQTTVSGYLASLSPEKRAVIEAARKLVRANIPKGYAEYMGWGVINWGIPLAEFSNTYNGQPLCYVALGAQKKYNALYLMGCYGASSQHNYLKDAFEKAGKKFDMGKCCLRFKQLDDLELQAVAKVIGYATPKQYLDFYKKVKGLD